MHGTARFFADNEFNEKATLDVLEYHMPPVEELFRGWMNNEKFSKLDLSLEVIASVVKWRARQYVTNLIEYSSGSSV